MISLLISILVLALIIGILFWALTLLPIPQPFLNVIKFILVLICLIYLLGLIPGVGYSHPIYR
jgi:hypothetical protein